MLDKHCTIIDNCLHAIFYGIGDADLYMYNICFIMGIILLIFTLAA
jgi:hypothetical protein